MPLLPLHKQVIIDPIYDSDYYNPSSQLIRIPDASKERCDQGIVKDLGSDCDPDLKIGDHIIFSGYTGTTVGVDGRVYIVVHSDFIKGKIKAEDYVVPGLYFRGKFDSKQIEEQLKLSGFNDNQFEIIFRILAASINDVIIPANYDDAIHLIAEAASATVAKGIDIKLDVHKEQRDPIDERNR